MFQAINLDFSQILTVSLTLFAVIDILGSIPVFITLREKLGHINAGLATIVSGGLMLLFFFTGEKILKIMGLDIPSFAIAGSIVIFILAIEMLLGLEIFKNEDANSKSGSIVPIAFPIIAGSGTLTTIISLKAAYAAENILAGILINLVFVFITLKSISFFQRVLGRSGTMLVRKFFGVILLAIAIKIFRSNVGF